MISLMYRSFGSTPPTDLAGLRHAGIGLLALAFVASSLLMLAIFNFFSLFFGVFVNFLGRDGVKFTFLMLFRRIPVIGFAPLFLTGYAVWQNAQFSGPWTVWMMPLVTAASAIVLIGSVVVFNQTRSGGRGGAG